MNIQTVIANLLNTIEGKEKLYQETFARYKSNENVGNKLVDHTMLQFLDINLQELNAILADCMAVREADIVRNLEEREKAIDQTPPKGTHDYV